MAKIVKALATLASLCGLYLFLAGSASLVELIAMAVFAVLGTGLSIGLRRVARESLVLRPPPRAILRPLAALLPETLIVGRALFAAGVRGGDRREGDFVHQPFDFGAEDPREAGRRAITLIGLSLAPQTVAVRGEHANGTALLHGFPPKPISSDRRWPT